MKPVFKKILLVVSVVIAAAICYTLYQWYKPHRNVQSETAVTISAAQLYQAFQANEKNPAYLDKAVQVSGTVAETKTNQAGKTVCYLDTNDPAAIINCTFTDSTTIQTGQQVSIKGRCVGYTGGDFPQATIVECRLIK